MKVDKILASALLLLFPLACGGDSDGTEEAQTSTPVPEETPAVVMNMELPEGVTAEMVAEGRSLFTGEGICYTCHGMDGEGGPLAPNLQDPEWIWSDGSYDQIVRQVMVGIPEPEQFPGIMLPKGGTAITDEQVQAVAAYVWTLSNGG
jgi:mono/diheme cytochrome c family protein